MTKKSIGYQQHLLKLMKKHGVPEMTVREWDYIAQQKGLPHAHKYIRTFGSFSEVKKQLGWDSTTIQSSNRKPYTKPEIETILKANKDVFLASESDDMMRIWEDYRKKHPDRRLPTYKTVTQHTTYDERLNYIQAEKKRYYQREKELLKELAIKHADKFTVRRIWDQWAIANDLPTSDKYIYLFESWEQAKKDILGYTSKECMQQQLINIGVQHHTHMTTTKKWNTYAEEHDLPLAHKFVYHFDSWKEAKKTIFTYMDNKERN
jgi:hypothetical protein